MNESVERVCVSQTTKDVTPVPAVAPGDFDVRIGEGWGGSLHDLAGELADWGHGPGAAVELLLTWCEWVEVEVRAFPEVMERVRLLRGAVMVAGSAVLGRYVLAGRVV